MLRDYRAWLESELKLLGNASHHAYSFGQANMAKRAIEKLDEELTRSVCVPLDAGTARRALTALELLAQQTNGRDPGPRYRARRAPRRARGNRDVTRPL